jgi:hypothetical protein
LGAFCGVSKFLQELTRLGLLGSCLCQGISSQGEWFSWAFGICRDKVICDLTGAVLNKQEEALWKHMMGKKFQHKLGELFFMLILFFFSPLVCYAAAES